MEQTKTFKEVKQSIINEIKKDNARDQECNRILNIIIGVVETLKNKSISKRIGTAVQKELKEYRVQYIIQYGTYQLELYALDKWEKLHTYTLEHTYNGATEIVPETLRERNSWADEPALKRIEQNDEILKNGRISEMAKTYIKYAKAKKEFDKAQGDSFYNPSYHSIQRVLEYNQRRR